MKKTETHPLATNLNNHFSKNPINPVFKNKAQALKDLFAPYKNCLRCPLGKQGRTQVVFGEGSHNAQLMFIGEGPGRDEDKHGRPFIGRAGKLLNEIIEAMNIKRDDVYISNVVKCRPPSNRTPLPAEGQTCASLLLFKEIEIIKPFIICTLGACATQLLISQTTRISHVRGIFHSFADMLLIPTYHPAYLLRSPKAKTVVLEDMKKIKNTLLSKSKTPH